MADVLDERTPEELAEIVLHDPGGTEDPQGFLAPIRATCPVFRGESGIVLVTGYDEARAVYLDPDRYSNAGGMANEAEWYRRFAKDEGGAEIARKLLANNMFTSDGDDHTRRRLLVRDYFSVRSVAAHRPMIDAVVGDLIDGVRGRDEIDVRAQLAFPLPERVIANILGAPVEDFHLWEHWAHVIGEFPRTRPPTESEVQALVEAATSFWHYFDALIDERLDQRGDDLISAMIAANADDKLSRDELIANVVLIISAGHDTTANMVCNGLYWLLRNPEEYRRLRTEPELVPAAIDELLRFEPSASFPFPRRALRGGEVSGVTIPEGSVVMPANHAANRDPSRFADPDRLDVGRYRSRGETTPHLSFGFGVHRCVGEHLAKAELESLLHAIVTELPELELVDKGPWRHGFHRHMEGLVVGVRRP